MAQAMVDNTQLDSLVRNVEQACAKFRRHSESGWVEVQNATEALRRAVEPPEMVVLKQRFRTIENISLIIAIEMGLLAALCSNENDSVSAQDLASLTGYDKTLIARVMRMITALGFADEIDHHSYKANAVTRCQNDPGLISGTFIANEWMYRCGLQVRDYVQQDKMCDPRNTTSVYEFAQGESLWDTFKKNADWKKIFDDTMTTRNKIYCVPWYEKFPVISRLEQLNGETAKRPVIIDIGGNQGTDLQRFATSHPDFPCELILQDLPETLDRISSPLDTRIHPTAHDFFTDQPVNGASIYYLKSILHDWDDVQARKILSNTAKAMDTNSTLLINEIVISDTNESIIGAAFDILMFLSFNGSERTLAQWTELLSSANPPLKIVKVWSIPKDQQSIIEAVLK